MRSTLVLTLTAFAATILAIGTASADDRLHLTPPLYREQARATQQTRSFSELRTMPQPVAAAAPKSAEPNKVVTEVVASAR